MGSARLEKPLLNAIVMSRGFEKGDKRMKASEARAITNTNLHGLVIKPQLDHIYSLIRLAAEGGRDSISAPFFTKGTYPTPAEREAIYSKLKDDGYKVVDHPDPDPGHPCSRPYTTISW